MSVDLEDKLKRPIEKLDFELKQQIDLKSQAGRATLARHICALANYGGGYIAVGFDDNGDAADVSLPDNAALHNDVVNSIARKYLAPPPNCSVHWVRSEQHECEVPLIFVPSHGHTPVCATKNGPVAGTIVQGTHYLRTAGPASEPITRPEDWAKVIRRAALLDRTEIVRAFTEAIRSDSPAGAEQSESLRVFEEFLHAFDETYLETYRERLPNWPVPAEYNHYRFAYRIEAEQGLPIKGLLAKLDQVDAATRAVVWTGWSMFYPFSPEESRPKPRALNSDGSGTSLLQTDLASGRSEDTHPMDFWWASPEGCFAIARTYREDAYERRFGSETQRSPVSWLSPETILRESAELVLHAVEMASLLDTDCKLEFRFSWRGLGGRELMDFDPSIRWGHGYRAASDKRITTKNVSSDFARANWERLVAELTAPALELFSFPRNAPGDIQQIEDLVRSMTPRFRKL